MAEAFPENVSDNSNADEEKSISVLLLASRWQFDTYGLSTVNKSLVNNLRVLDPEGKKSKSPALWWKKRKTLKLIKRRMQ